MAKAKCGWCGEVLEASNLRDLAFVRVRHRRMKHPTIAEKSDALAAVRDEEVA